MLQGVEANKGQKTVNSPKKATKSKRAQAVNPHTKQKITQQNTKP